MNDWIFCKDGDLPTRSGKYWVMYSNGEMRRVAFSFTGGVFLTDKYYAASCREKGAECKVVAWHPNPEPLPIHLLQGACTECGNEEPEQYRIPSRKLQSFKYRRYLQ